MCRTRYGGPAHSLFRQICTLVPAPRCKDSVKDVRSAFQIPVSRFPYRSIILTIVFLAAAISEQAQAVKHDPPRLVLQITVDQLHGDLMDRFTAGMGDGGFNRLLANGLQFANAHHRHANTETIVGQTTLATGADPGIHGMVANLRFGRDMGTTFYDVQDPDYPLLGASGVDADTEIDPTQRAATTDGRSPRNILTSTIGDEMRMHYGPDAKVFRRVDTRSRRDFHGRARRAGLLVLEDRRTLCHQHVLPGCFSGLDRRMGGKRGGWLLR